MTQKEKILEKLQKGPMTQSEVAEAIYSDKNHATAVHESLKNLVNDKIVIRSEGRPAYYSLSGMNVPNKGPTKSNNKSNKTLRDVSGDVINNDTLDEAENAVQETNNYGLENKMITSCLKRFPKNNDPELVAMKIGLIDITNSTHLSQYKSTISIVELAECIAKVPDIDKRIEEGDPSVVKEIAMANGKIKLFSFASKYCCYHNCNLYGKDDYSIYDSVLHKCLPLYFSDISETTIKKWKDTLNYKAYNDYITSKLDEMGITVKNRKRKFDHFVWYKNR